jgi:DNA-binding GntR family transcriptional regulator
MTERSRSPAAEPIAGDVHHRLRSKILTLELKPGTRLVEEEVCTLLGAGRTPVREALLRLEGERLVSRDRGWMVQGADPGAFKAIFEARMAIEGYATRLAAQSVTDDDLVRLTAMVDEMDRSDVLPRSQLNRINRAFHQAIVALSGNEFFIETHERTQFNYWNLRFPVVFMRDQLLHSAQQHRRILAALVARDGDEAEAAAREHIGATMRIVAEALED